ncbi:MAG: chorismate-binding protein [Chloroflexi bacterium]|nr:chorismate-binding protein [Chloroflexota bacterium]
MIVDMIRNDMGRVAETGSVAVPSLFDVARYPTVLQMTSTVTARTGASLTEIFQAMFPCASITGAPKMRTMEIIKELEPAARGVYTGPLALSRRSAGRSLMWRFAR